MEDLQNAVIKFRDERNWGQFHNAKDLAISLNLEASELLETFQWKSSEEATETKNAGNKRRNGGCNDLFTYAK